MEMVGLPKVVVIVVLLICLGSQVTSDASNHRYSNGDFVPFYANKVGPFFNPRETYAYYDLPFCSLVPVTEKKLNLGEMLNGDHLVSTPYRLEFRVEKKDKLLCKKRLSKSDVSRLISMIEKDYYQQFYYDDLPVWDFIGSVQNGYTDQRNQGKYSLANHFDFEVFYNNDRVIDVTLRRGQDFAANLINDTEVDVTFTYSVKWKATQQPFSTRMERYVGSSSFLPMSVHQDSIAVSSVATLLLIICLLTFYVFVIRKDIKKYSHDLEEDLIADDQEETGWKNLSNDVFRFPQHKSLFAAAIGSGTQLLILVVSVLVSGLLGFFQIRGAFWNVVVIVYAVTSLVSGYTSVSFYSQLEGSNLTKNLLLSAGIYFWPLCLTFGFLNSVAIFYGSTAALPLSAIVMLSLIWILFASPLLLLGGLSAKNTKSYFQAPCKTTKCPREIPASRWYRGLVPQMALAGVLPFGVVYVQLNYIFDTAWGNHEYTLYGIMSIAFVLLIIVTALVSVALTYFQLAAEDHEWWWRSFFCGGSSVLFMFGYCIYYYIRRAGMGGFLQTSFYFGYMGCFCYGMFLVLGTVGFCSSLLFVRYLYGTIKCN